MGGYGSGGWYRGGTKPTDENFHRLSIARLKECGVVSEELHAHGGWKWSRDDEVISSISYEINMSSLHDAWLRVHYTNVSTQERHDYKIHLSYTRPNYGGKRWWFLCPGRSCFRRVSVLYLSNVLVCRHCWGMAYASQNESFSDRHTARAFKLASKLGLDGNVIDGFYGEKPKGMHWKTYHRKLAEIEQSCEYSFSDFMWRFGKFMPE